MMDCVNILCCDDLVVEELLKPNLLLSESEEIEAQKGTLILESFLTYTLPFVAKWCLKTLDMVLKGVLSVGVDE